MKIISRICCILFLIVILLSCGISEPDISVESTKVKNPNLNVFLGDWKSIDSDIDYNLKIREGNKESIEISLSKKDEDDSYTDYEVQKLKKNKLILADKQAPQLVTLDLNETILRYIVSSSDSSNEGLGKPVLFQKH